VWERGVVANPKKHYRSGQKKNWRGWTSNRALEQLAVKPADALVLYLVGPEDHDREKLLAKGFRNENLIAVDLIEDHVQRVRDAGGFGICADLAALLLAWPASWPIDYVIADFCSGIEDPTLSFVEALAWGPAISVSHERRTVVAINLQRGRENSAAGKSLMANVATCLRGVGVGISQKNRAAHFISIAVMRVCAQLEDVAKECGWELDTHALASEYVRSIGTFPTYTYANDAQNVLFDSAVFTWPASVASFMAESPRLVLSKAFRAERSVVRDRIAALRAVRTMKLRAS